MKFVRLTGVKGGAVWVSTGQVTYLQGPESAENSLYGGGNSRKETQLWFVGGSRLEVRETPDDVAALFAE